MAFVAAKPWETDLLQGLPCMDPRDCSRPSPPSRAAERAKLRVPSRLLRSRIDGGLSGTSLNLRLVAGRSTGVDHIGLETCAARIDGIGMHVPLPPATHPVPDAEKLALMRPSAVPAGTARYAVVDSDALPAAGDLRARRRRGRGLPDVSAIHTACREAA